MTSGTTTSNRAASSISTQAGEQGAFTPGPWTFDRDWHRIPTIFGADGSKIASVEKDNFIHGKHPGIGHTEPKPEREANARLIAAAPDLLEALQSVVSYGYLKDNKLWFKCNAAVRKATGERS